MGKNVSVKFFREEIIRERLKALPEKVMARVSAALAESGDDVVRLAKQMVPVDQGVLRDSITWAWGDASLGRKDGKASTGYGLAGVIKRGSNELTTTISVGSDAAYLKAHKRPLNLPRWIEYGTQAQKKGEKIVNLNAKGKIARVRKSRGDHAGLPPRPYLFPAYRALKSRINARIKKVVSDVLGGK